MEVFQVFVEVVRRDVTVRRIQVFEQGEDVDLCKSENRVAKLFEVGGWNCQEELLLEVVVDGLIRCEFVEVGLVLPIDFGYDGAGWIGG